MPNPDKNSLLRTVKNKGELKAEEKEKTRDRAQNGDEEEIHKTRLYSQFRGVPTEVVGKKWVKLADERNNQKKRRDGVP